MVVADMHFVWWHILLHPIDRRGRHFCFGWKQQTFRWWTGLDIILISGGEKHRKLSLFYCLSATRLNLALPPTVWCVSGIDWCVWYFENPHHL